MDLTRVGMNTVYPIFVRAEEHSEFKIFVLYILLKINELESYCKSFTNMMYSLTFEPSRLAARVMRIA